jgi:hypothetical protein
MPDDDRGLNTSEDITGEAAADINAQEDATPPRMKLRKKIIFGIFLIAVFTLLAFQIDKDLPALTVVIIIVAFGLFALGLNALFYCLDKLRKKRRVYIQPVTKGQDRRKAQRHLGSKAAFIVLVAPCLLLCFGIALGIVISDKSPLTGWVRASDEELQAENDVWKEYWETQTGKPWGIGGAPVLLDGYTNKNYPIGSIGVFEGDKNSLPPGFIIIPPLLGVTVLPEEGLPSTEGRGETEDYVGRVRAWWDSIDKVAEGYSSEDYYYKDKEQEEIGKRKKVSEMPIAQVEDLKNGGSAARVLLTVTVTYEDGTEKASFLDTILIFGEERFTEIVIGGNDYDKYSQDEERIVDYIRKNYPNLEFPN